MIEPLLIAQLALLGLCTGFLAGLLGIGGGMIMVPFITAILSHRGVSVDLSIKMAIATSMATIIFTSISSVRAHHKRGAVRWDIVRGLAPGIVLGSVVASLGIFSILKGSVLAWIFAGFVGFSAVQMLKDKKPKPSRTMPGTAGQVVAGGAIGTLSGLVGAGGGFISVPFMVWCNVAIHNAVATSAALGFPHCLGQHHRLCDRRLGLDQLARSHRRLCVFACFDRHRHGQRVDGAFGRESRARHAGQAAQAGVCLHLVRLVCLHALQGLPRLSAGDGTCLVGQTPFTG